MPAIVMLGHDHTCPRCGPTTVTSGAEAFAISNRAVACVGDSLGCGATITSGSVSLTIEPLTKVDLWKTAMPVGLSINVCT
ncbi:MULTISPECIES: PAAR domain-containing protein [Pseudomonas]|uniref:PAAR domain-containing protein n=1 Tax=Pseudomonas TaxID=286 RepID=UPI001F0E14AA|nr:MULTISPECIES: PAAR domain-containing protein [Pseudomonas]